MSSIAKMSKHPFMDPHRSQKRSGENEHGAYWLIRRAHGERMKMQNSSITPLLHFMPLKVFIAYAGFMHFILFTLLLIILHICLQGEEAILLELPTHRPGRSYLSLHNMTFKFKKEKWIIDAFFPFFFSPLTIHIISFLSQLPIRTMLARRMGTGS